MRQGRKPKPGALSRKGRNPAEPVPPAAQPRCPAHLDAVARKEGRRLAGPLYKMGVLTVADRAAFAAYCQAYSRWSEAERKLAETPMLIKSPSGYVQQSPWLSIANRQMDLMCRYMTEMGLTPASRTRITVPPEAQEPTVIRVTTKFEPPPPRDANGRPLPYPDTIDGTAIPAEGA